MTFTEFRDSLESHVIGGHTFYVYEGLRLDGPRLKEWWDASQVREEEPDSPMERLIARFRDGKLVRWAPDAELTWCMVWGSFTKEPDGSQPRATIIHQAMQVATAEWEEQCGVRFREVQLDPGATETDHTIATFGVRHYDWKGSYVAYAFFPDDPPATRDITIDPSFPAGFDAVGVLRHELGHALGFHHEFIDIAAVKGLERIHGEDVRSTMNYPSEGGSFDFSFSPEDKVAARMVYGWPLGASALVQP